MTTNYTNNKERERYIQLREELRERLIRGFYFDNSQVREVEAKIELALNKITSNLEEKGKNLDSREYFQKAATTSLIFYEEALLRRGESPIRVNGSTYHILKECDYSRGEISRINRELDFFSKRILSRRDERKDNGLEGMCLN